MNDAIAGRRLRSQLIARQGLRRPEDVVAWQGAVQAQEYEPAKWALGLRMRDGVVAGDVEHACQSGRILRTHVMRPTWHFVAAPDIRWLLALTGPRVHRILTSYNRRLGLDARTLVKGTAAIEQALGGGRFLTRAELGEHLHRAGVALERLQLTNLVMHAELEAIVCSGPRRVKQQTYALLGERVPKATAPTRDEALAILSRRYFRSHGPATIRDFVWWSGLTVADARRGLEMNRAKREEIDGLTYWTVGPARRGATRDRLVYLLPIYDEYLIAYRDRRAVPHLSSGRHGDGGEAVTFQHALIIAGQVAGTWRTTPRVGAAELDVVPRRRLTGAERRALEDAILRYRAFIGSPVHPERS